MFISLQGLYRGFSAWTMNASLPSPPCAGRITTNGPRQIRHFRRFPRTRRKYKRRARLNEPLRPARFPLERCFLLSLSSPWLLSLPWALRSTRGPPPSLWNSPLRPAACPPSKASRSLLPSPTLVMRRSLCSTITLSSTTSCLLAPSLSLARTERPFPSLVSRSVQRFQVSQHV